jgi:type II secretory pathway component PulC
VKPRSRLRRSERLPPASAGAGGGARQVHRTVLDPPRLAAVVAGALLAGQAALSIRSLTAHPPVSVPSEAAPRATAALDVAAIGRLFGAAVVAPAPEIATNWRLTGVIAGADGSGWALLATDTAAAAVYAVGASLPGGGALVEVRPDAVRVRTAAGEELRVVLPRELGPAQLAALTGEPMDETVAHVPTPDELDQQLREGQRVAISGAAALFSYETVRDPDQRMVGLRVQPLAGADALAALRLQPGDVVVGVGDVTPQRPNALARELQKLGTGRRTVAVSVRRGDDVITSYVPPVDGIEDPLPLPPPNAPPAEAAESGAS